MDSTTVMYDWHRMDTRMTECDICPTMVENWGTGGNNMPYVLNGSEDASMEDDEMEEEKNEEQKKVRYVVRRITPTECERLQGFPNKGQVGPGGKVLERDYTDIPWPKSKDGHAPDSARYKALGNSMAVPVMRWIGERIMWALDHPVGEGE